MRRDLLTDLAVALETLPKTNWGNFDMGCWVSGDIGPESPTLTCGTVCCAIGLASSIPSFKAAGLMISNGYPHFRTAVSYVAIAHLLNIAHTSAELLFCPGSYDSSDMDDKCTATPLDVAARIREFLCQEPS